MSKHNKVSAAIIIAALLLAPFAPAVTVAASARIFAQQDDIPSDAEQAMFTKGQNLYNQGRYDQAITVLQDFLKTYPRSIITDLTLLWLGRSYVQMGKLTEAEQVAVRLRAIKDTPFSDIYEGELQTARAEMGSRPTTPARSTPIKPIPLASPTPTPASIARNIKPPTTTQGGTTTTTPGTMTAAKGTGGTKPQPRLVTAPTPDVTRNQTTPPANAARRNADRRRRVEPSQPTGGQEIAGQQVASIRMGAPVTNTQQPRTPGNTTTLASNNPPRTNSVSITPATRPTPLPVATNTNPPVTSETPARTITNPPVTTPVVSPNVETPVPQGGLLVTVKQVPGLGLVLRSASEFAQPGQSVQLPLTITNTGNKEDQFRLETDLPAEYQPTFSLAQTGTGTELPILVTPQLGRGASTDVTLNLRVPETASDGQQLRFTVRAASQADYRVMVVRDGSISVVAAALAGSSTVSESSIMPGDTFTQTISVRNSGSSPARATRADFVFNPNFELVNANPSPIAYDRASRTAIWSMGELGSRSTRDISVTLRAVPEALASTAPLGRGTVRTQSLSLASNFDSPSVTVGKVPKARIDAYSIGLTTTPGDTIYIPFIVRNPGNAVDAYELRVTAPGAPPATIYADTNGDGQHQEGEPAVTQTAQLEPRGGQFPLLLRVQIPSSTPDRQQFSYNVVARSLLSNRMASEANTVLTVATPRVRVRTEQVSDSQAPGDTIFYRLVLVNEGSGLAKNLVVGETLPDALEFINSDPSLNPQDAPGATQRFTWRVAELAPGDTAVLRVAVRLRPNLPADATLTTRHTLNFQDTNGNNYQGQ